MAAPTVGAVGADASDASATNVAVPAPSGVVAGSVVVVCIFLDSAAQTVTPPDGTWSYAPNSPVNVTGGSHGQHVFWHRATGSESGPYTFTWTNSTFRAANALRIDNAVSSGTPFDSPCGAAEDNTGGTVTPAVSTTSLGPDRLDLFVGTDWGGGTQGSAWTPPTGYTEHFEALYGTMTAASKSQPVAGSTGSVTATCAATDKRTAWIGAVIGDSAAVLVGMSPRAFHPGRGPTRARFFKTPRSTAVAAGNLFTVSLSGAINPAATLVRQPGKALAGATTPSAALTRQPQRAMAGSVTPAGTLNKLVGKLLAGAITPTGALTTLRLRVVALAGGITPTGSLVQRTTKLLAGVSTPAGALTRQPAKQLAGSTTPTSTLANIRTRLLALAGAIAPAGQLTRQPGKTLTGAVTPTGQPTQSLARRLTGSTTPTGALTRQPGKSVAGATTPSGALRRTPGRVMAGATTPTGAVTRRISKTLTGSTSPIGTVLKLLGRLLAGAATPVGALTNQPSTGGAGQDITVVATLAPRGFAGNTGARTPGTVTVANEAWTAVLEEQ